jgi:hypothetical protein
MRKKLEKMEDIRTIFKGVFVRYGTKNGYKGVVRTVLLKDISDSSGRILSDHLWFTLTLGFDKLGYLTGGEKIEFCARVKEYEKGYKGHDWERSMESPLSIDYKLSHPTKVRIVGDEELLNNKT